MQSFQIRRTENWKNCTSLVVLKYYKHLVLEIDDIEKSIFRFVYYIYRNLNVIYTVSIISIINNNINAKSVKIILFANKTIRIYIYLCCIFKCSFKLNSAFKDTVWSRIAIIWYVYKWKKNITYITRGSIWNFWISVKYSKLNVPNLRSCYFEHFYVHRRYFVATIGIYLS